MSKINDNELKEAKRAYEFSQQVRAHHRRRTDKGDSQREFDLQQARERLTAAMGPLRSYLARSQYVAPSKLRQGYLTRYRNASLALQSERRKVWKMQQPAPYRKKAIL